MPSRKPNHEQQLILDAWKDDPTRDLSANAFAGTGKTSTAQFLTTEHTSPALYICFNKNVQIEAEARFQKHVFCRTSHALAFRGMGMGGQKDRIGKRLFGSDVAALLRLKRAADVTAAGLGFAVIRTVANYTTSASSEIGTDHLPSTIKGADLTEKVIHWANALFTMMADPSSNVPITHDFYLKLFDLAGHRFSGRFSFIVQDEAQDTNPVTMNIIQRQGLPVIRIGDRYQSIYQFRGSVNALATAPDRLFVLSQSWRFGPKIAMLAQAILRHVSSPPSVPVRGNPRIASEIVDRLEGPHTIICRTNAGLFAAALTTKGAIHIIGGAEEMVRLVKGGWTLYTGGTCPHDSVLARFPDYATLLDCAEEDPDLLRLTRVIDTYGPHLPALLDELQTRIVGERADALTILTTAHKFKGDESDDVILADDFPTLDHMDLRNTSGQRKVTKQERDQELFLLYVATTRARLRLVPNMALLVCVNRLLASY